MKGLFVAARLVAGALVFCLVLAFSLQGQEMCSPKYEIQKTTEGLYQVTDCMTNEEVGLFDRDPRVEAYSPPQPRAYPQLSGFPVYFNSDGINTNIQPSDIDDDGRLEVCVPMGYSPYYSFFVIRHDGSNEPGFPKAATMGFDTTIYDCLSDGNLDYFVSNVNSGTWYEQFWDYQGNAIPVWPYVLDQSTQGWLTNSSMDDVTGDGIFELFSYGQKLVSSYYYPWIWGFDEYGNLLSGFPKQTTYQASAGYTTPAIADLDNDGQKEIIVAMSDTATTILAIEPNGNNVPSFPISFGLGRAYSPVIADIDNDGWNEIIFSTSNRVIVLAHDGTTKPGWPRKTYFFNYETECQGAQRCGGGAGPIAVADLNRDGTLEIVCGTENSTLKAMLFVFNADGTYYPGWPQLMTISNLGFRGTAVGDVDGDCVPDLIFAGYNSPANQSGLYGYHIDGTTITNFPLYVSTTIVGAVSPVLTDLNSDGYLDIGMVTDSTGTPFGTLEFFDLTPNPYNRSCIEWPMAHFDIRNTGRYRKLYQIDKTSAFTVDKLTIPADGESRMYLTACAATEGALPSNFNGDLSGQDVRFARNPVNGTFTGPVIDHHDGSYSRYLVAPYSDDPLTTNLMCWINEFKLNTIIPVTFLGRPVVEDFSPRVVKAGQAYTISVFGRNFAADIGSVSDSPKLQITGLTRLGDTALEVNVNVASDAVGFQSLRLFGYQRYSDSIPLIAYQPSDLLLLGDKPAITDAKMVWYGLDDPPGINFRLTRATTPTFSDAVVIYEGTDRNYTDSTAPTPIFYYKIEPE